MTNGKKEIVLNNVQNTWNENQQKFDDAIEMDQSNDQIVFDFPEFELQTDTNDLVPKEAVVVKNSISQIDLTEKIVKTQQRTTQNVNLTEKGKQYEKLLTKKCKICTKPFKSKANLKKHVKDVHEKIQPISCWPCKVTVNYLSEFRYHMDVVHEGKKLTEIDDFDYYVYCGIEGNKFFLF